MNNKLFRKKSIEKITSPEKLDDYIKIPNPSIWVVLISAGLLISGAVVWFLFGGIELRHDDGTVETVSPITMFID